MKSVSPGTIFDNRFEILCRIGEGGMGCVYKARQAHLDRVVALKVINHNLVAPAGKRFLKEAKVLSALKHPNIVECYGFGVFENQPYMALEYVDGVTLSSLLKKSRDLPWQTVNSIVKQICRGLSYAHENGIVHRDIKPSNILLIKNAEANQFSVKIVDFGLVRIIDNNTSEDQKLTATGSIIGSTAYMSPEQCQSKPADQRSDVYSLGCLIYHCLSGESPFVENDSLLSAMFSHVNEIPPVVSSNCSGKKLPQGLDNLVAKMLAKSTEDRYQSIDEVMADLMLIEEGKGLKLRYIRKDTQNKSAASPPGKNPASFFVLPAIAIALATGGMLINKGKASKPAVLPFERLMREAKISSPAQHADWKEEEDRLRNSNQEDKALLLVEQAYVRTFNTQNPSKEKPTTRERIDILFKVVLNKTADAKLKLAAREEHILLKSREGSLGNADDILTLQSLCTYTHSSARELLQVSTEILEAMKELNAAPGTLTWLHLLKAGSSLELNDLESASDSYLKATEFYSMDDRFVEHKNAGERLQQGWADLFARACEAEKTEMAIGYLERLNNLLTSNGYSKKAPAFRREIYATSASRLVNAKLNKKSNGSLLMRRLEELTKDDT